MEEERKKELASVFGLNYWDDEITRVDYAIMESLDRIETAIARADRPVTVLHFKPGSVSIYARCRRCGDSLTGNPPQCHCGGTIIPPGIPA